MRDGGRSAGERTSRKGEMTKKSVSTTWCVASGTRPSPAAACVMKPYAEILPRIRVSTGSANTRKERAGTRDNRVDDGLALGEGGLLDVLES